MTTHILRTYAGGLLSAGLLAGTLGSAASNPAATPPQTAVAPSQDGRLPASAPLRFAIRFSTDQNREPLDGRRNFTGRLASVADDDSAVTIEDEDGSTHTIPIAAIGKANLKIEI